MEAVSSAVKRLANRSGHRWAHHAVLVFRGGAIIAKGYNQSVIHAERSALNKLWPSERRGVTILSVRVTPGGALAMGKPCKACESYLRNAGVKSVVFSTQDGSLQKLKL